MDAGFSSKTGRLQDRKTGRIDAAVTKRPGMFLPGLGFWMAQCATALPPVVSLSRAPTRAASAAASSAASSHSMTSGVLTKA